MGEFAVNQKYPDSYRLDHPDFGDVNKTTYAKGVITEFEKISDDPLKVRSMVKVEIEGKGESDFIPLFYHPKKQYWDNEEENIKATDFNQEGKYFERAWMSFRAEDEVRVMLREGKPYAVVGFMDGKPRIGENIIQLKIGNQYWWDCEKPEERPDDNGPDGKPLKLLRPCERMLIKENNATYQNTDKRVLHSETYFKLKKIRSVITYLNPLLFPTIAAMEFLVATITPWYRGDYQNNVENKTDTIYRYLMPVGPILYLLEPVSTNIINTYSPQESFDNPNDSWAPFDLWSLAVVYYYRDGSIEYLSENLEDFYSDVNQWLSQVFPEADNPPGADDETNYTDFFYGNSDTERNGMLAALYTKELYDRAKNVDVIPSEFVKQTNFNLILSNLMLSPDLFEINKPDLKIYVRPHTKEELQEAGMWPQD